MVYMCHSFLIHLSVDGHLGCFHVLAIINSAVMNIGVHESLSDLVSLVCMPRSGISGSYDSSISSFFKKSLFSIAAVLVCIPTNSVRGSLFSTPSPAFIACRLLDSSHSDCTLPYLKWISNKNLLYRTGNFVQYYVTA